MVSLKEASQMPEFQRDGGRFAFLPFQTPYAEIKRYAFQAFIGKLYQPTQFWKKNIYTFVLVILGALLATQLLRRRQILPNELLVFLLSIFTVYFLSRPLAFHLYLPDRHLRAPMAIFFIVAFSVGIWRAFTLNQAAKPHAQLWALGGLFLLGGLICAGSGTGLEGSANFNYLDTKKGMLSSWLRQNTAEDVVVAGFPTQMDPVPLFAIRKAYASSETWHPFYPGYNTEIKRRLEISLRAHYAPDLEQLWLILSKEKIDYFAFERARFYPEALKNAFYFEPFRKLVTELTSGPIEKYAYRELPTEVDLARFPAMPFRDEKSALVDVAKLGEYLKKSTR